MTDVNQERLQLWLHDLRTTEAAQAKHALHSEGGYCCLGRLCVIAVENGANVSVEPPSAAHSTTWYDGECAFPPLSVKQWLGDNTLDLADFARMNDTGSTFKDIADAIEKRLGVLNTPDRP